MKRYVTVFYKAWIRLHTLYGVGSWLIALLTVSFQSYRVASSNPVETLRIE